MGIDAIYCAKTFYTIESLKLIVDTKSEFGRKSHERLLEDIMDYRKRYVSKLKNALYDYTALVVFGEMRHGVGHSTHYNPQVPEGGNRNGSYKTARQYNPTSILIAGEKLFGGNNEWHCSFGGKKWQTICNRVLLKDVIDDAVYCDMCFSLTHNCSPYLDKYQSNIFQIDCSSDYKRLLDFKFNSKNPQDVVEECVMFVSKELKRLVSRAVALGFIDKNIERQINDYWSPKQYDAEKFIMNYESIEWGGIWLNSKFVKHRESLGRRSYSALPEYVDHNDVKEGDVLEIKYDSIDGYDKIKKGMLVKVVGKGMWSDSLEVVFEEDIRGHDLDGKCEDGHGLRLEANYFIKHLVA